MKNQLRRRYQEDKENNYRNNDKNMQEEMWEGIRSQADRYLCDLLIGWREHYARIVNKPPQKLITFEQVVQISLTRPTSLLELQ